MRMILPAQIQMMKTMEMLENMPINAIRVTGNKDSAMLTTGNQQLFRKKSLCLRNYQLLPPIFDGDVLC